MEIAINQKVIENFIFTVLGIQVTVYDLNKGSSLQIVDIKQGNLEVTNCDFKWKSIKLITTKNLDRFSKKWFAFSKMDSLTGDVLNKLKG